MMRKRKKVQGRQEDRSNEEKEEKCKERRFESVRNGYEGVTKGRRRLRRRKKELEIKREKRYKKKENVKGTQKSYEKRQKKK